jgi:integrase
VAKPSPEEPRRPRTHMFEGANGNWHAYVYVGRKADGSPDRRHREAATEEALAVKVLDLEDTVDESGAPKVGRSKKFAAWLDEWITLYAPLQVRYKTVECYRSNIRNYLAPRLGEWRLSELTKRHFTTLYRDLQGEGLAPASVHLVHRTASVALSRALEFEEVGIRVNQAAEARKALPQVRSDAVIPLDADEVERITTVVAEERNHVRWWIAFLGARQGEVLGLKWADVDWGAGIINIRRQLQRRTYTHGCGDAKNCAKLHCTTAEGCEVSCPNRKWEHGCTEPAKCALRHCMRPVYQSDIDRGTTRRPCPVGCTGHGRACPDKRRSECKLKSHRIACPVGCTDHAMFCPQREGGLVLSEPDPEPVAQQPVTAKGKRGARKTKRELRPKSEAGRRRLPLPRVVLDELRVHQARQTMERREAGSMWNDRGLIFTTALGDPIDPRADWETWGEILDEADVDYIHLHGARHSAATFLGGLGVDSVIAMAMLGWASPSMAKRYQHVPDADLTAAADKLGKAAFRTRATVHATEGVLDDDE